MSNQFEFVSSRKQVAKISSKKFYEDVLEEYLDVFKKSDISRRNWTLTELEVHLKKIVSTEIMKNEFHAGKAAKLTKKKLIANLERTTGIPTFAMLHVYDSIWEQLGMDDKNESKNFILVQVYNDIDNLDTAIDLCKDASDKATLQREKTRLLELLAKATQVIESGKGININAGSQVIDNSLNKQTLTQGISSLDLGSALQSLLPQRTEYIEAKTD